MISPQPACSGRFFAKNCVKNTEKKVWALICNHLTVACLFWTVSWTVIFSPFQSPVAFAMSSPGNCVFLFCISLFICILYLIVYLCFCVLLFFCVSIHQLHFAITYGFCILCFHISVVRFVYFEQSGFCTYFCILSTNFVKYPVNQ